MQIQSQTFPHTKRQYMRESNIRAGNATIKQLQREVLIDTKGEYMKESNILARYATIKQLQSHTLLNTKGQCMKEATACVSPFFYMKLCLVKVHEIQL